MRKSVINGLFLKVTHFGVTKVISNGLFLITAWISNKSKQMSQKPLKIRYVTYKLRLCGELWRFCFKKVPQRNPVKSRVCGYPVAFFIFAKKIRHRPQPSKYKGLRGIVAFVAFFNKVNYRVIFIPENKNNFYRKIPFIFLYFLFGCNKKYIQGVWFQTRHKRHKIRKPSNHAALRRDIFIFKNATCISHPANFTVIVAGLRKKITENILIGFLSPVITSA